MTHDSDALLARFWSAFNSRDPESIAATMTDDVVLEASFGPAVWGTRVVGSDAVRAFYVDMFAKIPDAHWTELRRLVGPSHIVVESVLTGTVEGRGAMETAICDVLTLRDGKIAAKRSYRKAFAGS